MDPTLGWVQLVVAIFASMFASTGLWAFITRKSERKSATTQLLLGMAHDRLVYLGMSYITRGSITHDEYEDYVKYLYEPYSAFGGNGLAERVMKEVTQLPLTNKSPMNEIKRDLARESERSPDKPYGD